MGAAGRPAGACAGSRGVSAPRVLAFDSGVGGLSVVQELRRAMPGLELAYAADTAWLPYSAHEPEALRAHLVELLPRLVDELRPDILVIACNTASTVALDAVRARLPIPVVGTVPAVKPAAALTQSGVIGVLATPVTVFTPYLDDLVARFAPGCHVLRLGSRRLVELAEAQLRGQPLPPGAIAGEVAALLQQPRGAEMDVAVLACTHFPLLRDALAEAAGRPMHWLDSGAAIARRTADLLQRAGLVVPPAPARPGPAIFTGGEPVEPALAALLRDLGLTPPAAAARPAANPASAPLAAAPLP